MNTASVEEKEEFKKMIEQLLVVGTRYQKKKKGFTAISLDESFSCMILW